jgi:hypothetical protein
MSTLKELVMHESSDFSRVCASALLDAYYSNDAPRMSEIAEEVSTMGTFYASNFAESERLELVGGIAAELHGSSSLSKPHHVDPYIKLLMNLAHPEWLETCFAHGD